MTRAEKIEFLQSIDNGTGHPDLLDTLPGVYIALQHPDGTTSVPCPRWGYPYLMDAPTLARYQQRISEFNARRRVAGLPLMGLIICPA